MSAVYLSVPVSRVFGYLYGKLKVLEIDNSVRRD